MSTSILQKQVKLPSALAIPTTQSKCKRWVWIECIQRKGPEYLLTWPVEDVVAWYMHRLQKHRQRHAKNKNKSNPKNDQVIKKKQYKKPLYKPKNIIFGANVTFDHV